MLSEHSLIFGDNNWLWALLLVLPLGFLFYWAEQKKKNLLSKIVAERLRSSLIGGVSVAKRWMRFLFLLLSFIFALLSLAQPRMGYEEREVKTQGRDVILVIDVSRSMLSTDVAPTRLARAQLLGQDLLDLLPGDRIGLVAFAGKGFLEAPLTLDHSAIRDALTELDMNLIPKGGTNIADALEVALSAFGKGEGYDRSIILITDGEELEASGVALAKEAATRNIKIFTIGIGSAEGSLIPIKNELGENDFVRDEHGKPVLSKLDVARLQEIAKVTGGFYEPFGTDAIRTIVEKGIKPLTASNTSSLNLRRPLEWYAWPLAAALFFLTLWCLSSERRRKKTLLLLFLLACCSSVGEATSGISAYSQGDYAHALRDFEQQIEAGSRSEALRFDAGTAAYKAQDYKKAEAYFTQAMTSSSKSLQQAATYNLANTLVRQGEATQKKEEKMANWNNALQHYETVLKTDPHNKSAQENRDLVKKMIEKLKQEKEPEPPKNQSKQSSQDQKNNNDKKDQQKNEQQKNNQNNQSNSNNSRDQQQNQQNQQQQNQPQQNPQNSSDKGSSDANGSSQNPDKNSDSSPSSPDQKQGSSSPKQQENQKENSQQPNSSPLDSNKTPNQQQGQDSQSSPSPNKENKPSQGNAENQQQGSQDKATPTPQEKKQGTLTGGEQGKQEEGKAAAEKEEENGMSQSQAEAVLRSVEDEERRVPFSQQQENSEEVVRDW